MHIDFEKFLGWIYEYWIYQYWIYEECLKISKEITNTLHKWTNVMGQLERQQCKWSISIEKESAAK